MDEVWKDIDGYNGIFQVSNLGRVRSIDRFVKGAYGKRWIKGKIFKPVLNKSDGYLRVVFMVDGISKRHYIHRLIANAFLPKIKGKEYVNHIDGNKLNNSISNLEWCTLKENQQHAFRIGLNHGKSGTANNNAKLSSQMAKEIIKDYQSGTYTYRELAKKYHVGHSTIGNVITKSITY